MVEQEVATSNPITDQVTTVQVVGAVAVAPVLLTIPAHIIVAPSLNLWYLKMLLNTFSDADDNVDSHH